MAVFVLLSNSSHVTALLSDLLVIFCNLSCLPNFFLSAGRVLLELVNLLECHSAQQAVLLASPSSLSYFDKVLSL